VQECERRCSGWAVGCGRVGGFFSFLFHSCFFCFVLFFEKKSFWGVLVTGLGYVWVVARVVYVILHGVGLGVIKASVFGLAWALAV